MTSTSSPSSRNKRASCRVWLAIPPDGGGRGPTRPIFNPTPRISPLISGTCRAESRRAPVFQQCLVDVAIASDRCAPVTLGVDKSACILFHGRPASRLAHHVEDRGRERLRIARPEQHP